MEISELHFFEKKNHEIFPINRKSDEYKQINLIRTNLLKINAKEAENYLNQNIRINSQTTKDYIKKSFESITINLKTKQIKNAKKTRVSFINNNISDLDIEPFFNKCNHHFHKFQNRKKVVLAKHGLHYEKESSDSDKSERNNEYDFVKNNNNRNNHNHYHDNHHCHDNHHYNDEKKEEMFNLIIGKINQKTYFNYLHSLFYTLHKNIFNFKSKREKKVKNNLNNIRKSSPAIIKIKNNIINNNININTIEVQKEIKKCNSNEYLFNSGIIKLIQCEEK